MIKVRLFSVVIVGLIGFLLTSFLQEKKTLIYMQVPTIESSTADEPLIVQTYKGRGTKTPIFLRKTKDNIPLHYFKEIKGKVCFNEECRFLDIVVYWNITGRYLGFELPKGEFLSTYDHEPFSENEYQRLHALLADESLPLDRVSFEELLEQPNSEQEDVDAISGATSKNIAAMVIKGAAFTTFKLWNTVNGTTMDVVSELTEKQLTPALLHRILKSQDVTDTLWALHRMDAVIVLTPPLETTLLELIVSDDFYVSYSAIKAINSIHLKSADLQKRLFLSYQKVNHSIQTALIKKLMEAPFLSLEIICESRKLLGQLNGQQLDDMLQLYTKHRVNDMETYTAVAKILKNENKYISKKAYTFLSEVQTDNEFIIERLNVYKKQKP